MKAEIFPERCIACGLCQTIAPEIFDYRDDGIVIFSGEEKASHQFIPEASQKNVQLAAKRCPAYAISYDSL